MSKTDYENKINEIIAISNEQIFNISVPVAAFIQESEDLYEWSKSDSHDLINAGLNPETLKDLPVRAGALRYAQSIWQKEYNTYEDAQKEWNERSPAAFDLRDVIVHHFLHAYYHQPDILAKVRAIAEGYTNADMLQDLSDLTVLGKAFPQPLVAINFDLTLLDEAEKLSSELSEILAKSNGLRISDNEYKIIRDKAYTYLKYIVDEVRRYGQYIFWRTPERRKGYSSRYLKKASRHSKSNESIEA